jgi:hypothetical protein
MNTRKGLAAAAVVLGALSVSIWACDKAAASTPAASDIAAASAPAATHIDGNNFKVDTSVSDCTAGSECTGTVRLEALGGYHINDTYPYKLTVAGAEGGKTPDGVELLGKDPANKAVFGKNNGDFEKQAEKVAVVTVRFKAPKGKVAFAGKFKLSVCSEANCQLDQADVSFEGVAK